MYCVDNCTELLVRDTYFWSQYSAYIQFADNGSQVLYIGRPNAHDVCRMQFYLKPPQRIEQFGLVAQIQ